jgi:predicted amidophosphoribosyltransferase
MIACPSCHQLIELQSQCPLCGWQLQGMSPECEESVIKKIKSRREAGRVKYGTTMERTDLTRIQWLKHAQEEAMDLAIYLERLIKDERE